MKENKIEQKQKVVQDRLKKYSSISKKDLFKDLNSSMEECGTGLAIVLATGSHTYFGNMAKSLYTVNEKNSFEKGIDSVSNLLIKFMVAMLPIFQLFLILEDYQLRICFGL